jgi:D-ribose pyranose/furanose isomerase RbsD
MTPPAHGQHSESMNMPMPPAHEQALLSMLSNMDQLTELYKAELDAIELRDMQLFSEIQPKKVRLVQDCENHMTQITGQAGMLKSVSPALKERIFTSEDNLRELATKSQRACKIRAESVKRVQERLLDAARHIMSRDRTMYNKHGMTDQSKTKPVSTAINQAT